jgi:hypothetical protein
VGSRSFSLRRVPPELILKELSASDIALCKGLKAEGHRVRIASHGEYKDWIEGVSLVVALPSFWTPLTLLFSSFSTASSSVTSEEIPLSCELQPSRYLNASSAAN